jgi:hypothetical protein
MGLRTDCGLIVSKIVEVLPMVADVLTVLSFSVLIVNKVIPVISQNVGCVLSIKELLLLQGERQQLFLVLFIKICFVSIGAEY